MFNESQFSQIQITTLRKIWVAIDKIGSVFDAVLIKRRTRLDSTKTSIGVSPLRSDPLRYTLPLLFVTLLHACSDSSEPPLFSELNVAEYGSCRVYEEAYPDNYYFMLDCGEIRVSTTKTKIQNSHAYPLSDIYDVDIDPNHSDRMREIPTRIRVETDGNSDTDWSFDFESFGIHSLCCNLSLNDEELDKLLRATSRANEYQITFEMSVLVNNRSGTLAITDFKNRISNFASRETENVSEP